jgi:hypothetical protein
MSDPTAVFYSAVHALKAKAWEQAAELCDPASLSLFKRELLSRVHSKPSQWTVEQLRRYEPEMPVEVAEYQVAHLNKLSDSRGILSDEVPSIASIDDLEAMAPVSVFAAWLEGNSHERQVERSARHSSMPADVVAEALQHPMDSNYVVLGTVPDGDRLIHVVFRREWVVQNDADEAEQPDEDLAADLTHEERAVLKDRDTFVEYSTLRRQSDGRWCMIAGHSFLGRSNPVFMFGSTDEPELDNA